MKQKIQTMVKTGDENPVNRTSEITTEDLYRPCTMEEQCPNCGCGNKLGWEDSMAGMKRCDACDHQWTEKLEVAN